MTSAQQLIDQRLKLIAMQAAANASHNGISASIALERHIKETDRLIELALQKKDGG